MALEPLEAHCKCLKDKFTTSGGLVYQGLDRQCLRRAVYALISSSQLVVSGGTWSSSIYIFGQSFKGSPLGLEDLLGVSLAPAELSMQRLNAVPAIASGLVKGDSTEILAKALRFWMILERNMCLNPLSNDECLF